MKRHKADPAGGVNKFPVARFRGFLHEVLASPGNEACADCGAKNPRMAALNIGVLLCYECAQLHSELLADAASAAEPRRLTASMLPLEDDVRFSDAAGDYLMLQRLGNTVVNAVLEARIAVDTPKPKPSSAKSTKLAFIQAKYGVCAMVDPAASASVTANGAAATQDVEALLGLVASGRLTPATVAGTNALLTAVENDAPHAADFLLLNGADVNHTTAVDGSTPLHVASAAGHAMCVRVLLRHSADHTIENGAGQLAADVAADPDHTATIGGQSHSAASGGSCRALITGEAGLAEDPSVWAAFAPAPRTTPATEHVAPGLVMIAQVWEKLAETTEVT